MSLKHQKKRMTFVFENYDLLHDFSLHSFKKTSLAAGGKC